MRVPFSARTPQCERIAGWGCSSALNRVGFPETKVNDLRDRSQRSAARPPSNERPTPRAALAFAAAATFLVGVGCNAVFDIEEGRLAPDEGAGTETDGFLTAADGGATCVLSSDCVDDSLICIFRVCSAPCRADRDCQGRERCLQTDDGMACVFADTAQCEVDDDCPSGSACSVGECRNSCTGDVDCLEDQQCDDGRCIGSQETPQDTTADADDSDQTAETGLSETDSAGTVSDSDSTETDEALSATDTTEANTDLADTDVQETDTDQGTDPSTDAGTEPPDGQAPTDCDDLEEGSIVCDAFGSTTRSICQSGDVLATTPCTSGNVCDPMTGTCEAPATECIGRSPGEVYCSGALRIACAPTLLEAETASCASNAHCQAGTGPNCAVCLDGTFSCVDNQIRECSPDGTEWMVTGDPPCTSSAPCNPDTGTCTSLACLSGQKRCQGDALEECNSDQSGFVQVELCAPGLCDPINFECDACAASTAQCAASGTDRLVCASNGQSTNTVACSTTTPYCRGSGECVECTTDNHCPTAECSTPTCNTGSGTCSLVPVAPGTDCSTGVCNGAGSCVECAGSGNCTAQDGCHVADCVDGRCTQEVRGAGIECNFDGGSVCNASGTCVECNDENDCTAAECFRPICSSERCDETAESAGTPCGAGDASLCDGSGNCVRCLTQDDCEMTELCRDGDCVEATDTIGWPTASASSLGVFQDDTYLRRLPPLEYSATVTALGATGTGVGATIRIAVYADNGSGTSPEGARLGETQFTLTGSAKQGTPSPGITLAAGVHYWLAFKIDEDADIALASGGPSLFARLHVGGLFGSAFATFGGDPDDLGTDLTGAFAVYADIQYTE